LLQHQNEFSIDFTNTSALERCILNDYQNEFAQDLSRQRRQSAGHIIDCFFRQIEFIDEHQYLLQKLSKQFLQLPATPESFFKIYGVDIDEILDDQTLLTFKTDVINDKDLPIYWDD